MDRASLAKNKEKEVIVIDEEDEHDTYRHVYLNSDDSVDREVLSCRTQRAKANQRMRNHYKRARETHGTTRNNAIIDSLKEGMKILYYARKEAEMLPDSAERIVVSIVTSLDSNIKRLQHYVERAPSCATLMRMLCRQKNSLLMYHVHSRRVRSNGIIPRAHPSLKVTAGDTIQ